MYYRVIKLKAFKVCGFSTEFTSSMSQNFTIAQRFWQVFNRRIKTGNLTQGKVWTKYAFTYNKNNKYRYFIGIPFIEPTPLDFEVKEVPESYCMVFEHRGKLENLNNTINRIYREFIPKHSFKPETKNYYHFEKYDYRFMPNSDSSLIEIYVPLNILGEVIYEDD